MAKMMKYSANDKMGVTGGMNPHKTRRNSPMPADPLQYKSKLGTSTKASNQKMPKKKQIKGGY